MITPTQLSAHSHTHYLTDRHLTGYFSNTRIRRHLQRAGLITRSGRIVPDKEYRHKLIQRAHQRHVRECLAQAIFHKVLEMERLHQIEIKKKLEEFARRERVHKIKVHHLHLNTESRRRLTTVEASHGISPYCLPVINNFVTPVPPATKRKERGVKVTPSSTLRGRRLRPTTASSGADITEVFISLYFFPGNKTFHNKLTMCVNMVYFGKTVHLSHDLSDMRDEVKVFQQHCGGENLCVYKGKLCEGESFQFISRRHRGFPFSLTFFLNGLQVERLSSCCEFKHRKGSRLGGRHGHFGFSSVEGASPCYKKYIFLNKLLIVFCTNVAPEKPVTFTEQQQTLREEMKQEESAGVGQVEGVQDLEETSEPKEQEDETEKQPHENSDNTKAEMVKIDEDDEKPASEEAAAEKEKLEDTGADLHPVSEENMTEENKTSEPEEDAAAESNDADAAQKDEENEEKTAEVEEVKPDETGQGAKSSVEDESSVSEPNKTTDETAASDNAEERMTASETMEMKAEPSEEREALSCEEAPVTDTEEKQQADSEDRTEASETEVTAENSSSSLEGSGDTTVEKTADISEDNAKDEGSKDDIKEEEADEVSAAEASKDGSQQERLGEEQTEKSVEIDDEVEKEKIEEDSKEEEKQTNSDETTTDENYKTEEEGNDESKTEERMENEEIIVEDTKTNSNTAGETNEEPAEKTLDGQDKVANEERADESEKTEKDEESECVENKNDEEESEAKGAITDKTNEGEEIKETKTDADEEKGDEAENEEEDDNENKAPQSESEKNKNLKESEEEEIIICKTGEGEEISVMTEEPERNPDDVKISNENTVESEVVGDNEAAGETKANEEMLNNVMECEDVGEETEEAGTDIENGEVDAENGEISTRAESKTHDDTTEASTEDNNDVKAAEHVEDEGKTEEEPAEDESAEVKEVTVESGDDKVDQGPDTDVVESEATEGDQSVEKQDESAQKDSEQETVVTEIKERSTVDGLNEDRDDREETKDENGNKSDLDNENRDSDSTRNNDNNVHEVIVASSAAQAQSSTPDLGGTTHLLDETPAVSDKHPHSDENAAAAAVNLSAADGENGADTEEASKASEEGASVLLKPQAQNNEADNAEECVATGKETPEALAAEDSTDLVTNWVTMHQTSKFFQTFVEPLEDLKEEASQTQVSISSEEATKSTELPRSESPLKMVKMSENAEEEQMHKDENETTEKNKVGAVESHLEIEQTQDGEHHENEPARHTLQDKEETEVQELIPKTETEDNEEESTNGQRKGSRGSLEEDKVQDEPTLTQNEISKTEVESIAGTHHSVASGKPESVIENQSGEETTDNGPDLNEKQTETEEIKGLLPSSKTEEHCEHSASPDGLKDTEEMQGKTEEQSHEVTEITDFTTSKSEDGSQEESHNGEIQPKPTDGSINGERRDVQLIQDIKHTLSKDRLSTFSVDETLFGRSSYPSLTAARTESGH
uniref:Glutamate rich 3 n=1 Tax=Seriola lalandi dorsalis TaxID=1841481 RepID=A0A3B4Y1D6_SERLL